MLHYSTFLLRTNTVQFFTATCHFGLVSSAAHTVVKINNLLIIFNLFMMSILCVFFFSWHSLFCQVSCCVAAVFIYLLLFLPLFLRTCLNPVILLLLSQTSSLTLVTCKMTSFYSGVQGSHHPQLVLTCAHRILRKEEGKRPARALVKFWEIICPGTCKHKKWTQRDSMAQRSEKTVGKGEVSALQALREGGLSRHLELVV